MKIRYLSDLHLKVNENFVIPNTEDEENTVLIVAGDIAGIRNYKHHTHTFADWNARFRLVIIVLGNHEHYFSDIQETSKNIKSILAEYDNIVVLDDECIILDNIRFIGSTLWTGNYISDNQKMDVSMMLNDFRLISNGEGRRLTVDDTINIHESSKNYIFNAAKDDDLLNVVISHHAPSMKSITTEFKNSGINAAFVSDLDEEIEDSNIDIWFHGHVHSVHDYYIGGTRVLCNPRGYIGMEYIQDYSPTKIIRL